MIARKSPQLTKEHQQQFVEMLPKIVESARIAFQDWDGEGKEEAVAQVVAAAFVMFVSLVRRGREGLAFATPLAMYGIRQTKSGRRVGTPMNGNDVTSRYCQVKRGIKTESLDRYDRESGDWEETVLWDKHATPDVIAQTHLDFLAWLTSLPRRTRRIAEKLASGETTSDTAKRFDISAGRISQLRTELARSWREFTDDSVPTNPAALALAAEVAS